MIYGDIEGIRESLIEEMERLYDIQFERAEFLPDRLAALIVRFTEQLNRELLIYLSRDGEVLNVAVGALSSVGLTEMHLRRNLDRLTGFRCIHTHTDGSARLTDIEIQALKLLRFDSMCVVGVLDGRVTGISAAFLGDIEYSKLSVAVYGPVKPGRVPHQIWLREIELSEARVAQAIREGGIVDESERVMLISTDSDDSLSELASLADTAGAVVVSKVLQKRPKPDPATYIGSGKAESLMLECQTLEVDLAIVDDELSGAQQKNLEKALGTRVIDRTQLILDIFARRAQTAEGKLQVELAQMKYRLPRLSGEGADMSRLGGGIGTRGPGETQLEADRRRIRGRIDDLNKELKELTRKRDLRRARRDKQEQVIVALVGYTNAGKSTLLNALTGADALTEDKLFATLDPIVRQAELNDKRKCLIVDTVGFIRKLPHTLVEAFKSTLEEAVKADLIVIVSDYSSPAYLKQREVVLDVLAQLGARDKPMLEALNKSDKLTEADAIPAPDAILVSALIGKGLDDLRCAIAQKVSALRRRVELTIPYDKGAALNLLHEKGQVESEEYTGEGTKVICEIDATLESRLQKLLNAK